MSPNVADLIDALPDEGAAGPLSETPLRVDDLMVALTRRPVPTGALHRLWTLGGLHARLGVAWLIYWIRGWTQPHAARDRRLLETQLASAIRLLETMGYLRGAILKLGQTAATLPEIVPESIVDVLSALHFQAPPLHFSLLREFVHNELGGDPEDVFASFDTTAFAAASLGQVHRARLKSGEDVAVKIQYPGIARTIRSDFRNLAALMLPLRFGRDWENLRDQFDEIRRILEMETDYEQEAAFQKQARGLFREDDGIVVPRVYDEFSTRRVLTMEYVSGRTFYELLAENPPQHVRNEFGRQILRGYCRLLYAGHMEYADPHPGNVLFLDDGRIALLDFGCMRAFNDDEWEYLRISDEALYGDREQVITAIRRGTEFTHEELQDTEMLDAMVDYCRWIWEPFTSGEFDFGDRAYVQRGIEIIKRFVGRARPRQKPVNVFIQRALLAGTAVQHRLGSRFDARPIIDEEVAVTGWRRGADG